MIIIFFSIVVTASAIALIPDHHHHDSIPITAIFQHEAESFLNYAKDYVSSTTSFLINIIEEPVISKQKDYLVTTPSLQYNTIEDRYEKVIEGYQVNITVEVTVVGGEVEVEGGGEVGRR